MSDSTLQITGHTIEMEGRVAHCTVCDQQWGDCNRHDVRNLTYAMACPGGPVRPVPCPAQPNVICYKRACYDGCASDPEEAAVAVSKITIYKDLNGEWRWRMVASNGRIIADSAEGYKRRSHALRMAKKIAAGGAAIVDGKDES